MREGKGAIRYSNTLASELSLTIFAPLLQRRKRARSAALCYGDPSAKDVHLDSPRFLGTQRSSRIVVSVVTVIALNACLGCDVTLTPSIPSGSQQGSFSLIGKLSGIGDASSSAVGPAPNGKQRYYISYIYDPSAGLDIVGVDSTGKVSVFPTPVASEFAGYGTLVGVDGNMYFGTVPHAHVLRLNTNTDQLDDMGVPASSEQYIWELTNGGDGKIYGCTYPSAKLVRYDPKTLALEDLGRMDDSEEYARTCAADQYGFIYVGIGSNTSNIAAYEIATGQHREIIPTAYLTAGFGQLVTDGEGKVHGRVGNHWFGLTGWTATPENSVPMQSPNNVFADGTMISISGGTVQLENPATNQSSTLPYAYKGKGLPVFRIGMGPDNALYASTALPFYLFKQGANGFSNIGQLGDGEAYSFLPLNGRLLIGAYSALAPLMSYDVTRGIANLGPEPNPTMVVYPGENEGWRPLGMIAAEDGNVYIASIPGYGVLNSPLTKWDPQTNSVSNLTILQDQSTTSIVCVSQRLVVGTSISGGPGTSPTASQSMLVLLDSNDAPTYMTAPVKGAKRIANLVALPSGEIVGIADKTAFLYDLDHRELLASTSLSSTPLDNSLTLGPDGNLWGLTSDSIFRLDKNTLSVSALISTPNEITSGIAMDGANIYFGSNSDIYSFNWKSVE